MASSIALDAPVSEGFFKQSLRLIPGLLLLGAVGYAGRIIERSMPPTAKRTT